MITNLENLNNKLFSTKEDLLEKIKKIVKNAKKDLEIIEKDSCFEVKDEKESIAIHFNDLDKEYGKPLKVDDVYVIGNVMPLDTL